MQQAYIVGLAVSGILGCWTHLWIAIAEVIGAYAPCT